MGHPISAFGSRGAPKPDFVFSASRVHPKRYYVRRGAPRKNLPLSFTNTFFRSDDLYEYSTRQATSGQLYTPQYKTTTFGLKCIYKRCIDSWNKFSIDINTINRKNNVNNLEIKDIDLLNYSRKVLKDKLTKHVLSTYIE